VSFEQTGGFVLPRPGRALKGVMLTLFGIWLAFALGLNWAGVPPETFALFAGNTERVFAGQIWRLFTAPLLNEPSVGAIFFVLLGLYFLTPALEEQWGGKRLIQFLIISSVFAYAFQMLLQVVLPDSISQRLVGPVWYSSFPAVEAVAIAFALSFRGRTVRLFFILPVSSRGLILFVVGISVLYVITLQLPSSGLIAPFGGMIAGWLFGGSPSPIRRAWLKMRLASLEREAQRDSAKRKRRVKQSNLRVISGGRDDDDDDGRGPDGKLLN
jgi:membrane associated rhomboid family serine protease